MNELVILFTYNLLPIFFIAGAGALLAKFTNLDPRTLSQVIFYIFSPCLIFNLLTHSELSSEMIGLVILYTTIFTVLIGGLVWVIGKVFKFGRSTLSALLLSCMFMNAGNFGMPIALFAFGQNALSFASLFFVTNISLAYTLGTLIASMSTTNLTKALLNLFKLPIIYAVLIALLFMNTGWEIPVPLDRSAKLLGDASIPSMLVLLGLHLKTASIRGRVKPIAITTAVRLLASPLLAALLLPLFGLTGVASQALTLQAGMPTAVMTTMLATEFDAEPAFISAAVFVTTMLSPLTITPLLSYLGA